MQIQPTSHLGGGTLWERLPAANPLPQKKGFVCKNEFSQQNIKEKNNEGVFFF